jgi:hypothetical protein
MRATYILLFLLFIFINGGINAQSITISEINYKDDPTIEAGDWFELHNFGTSNIDISGWVVIDSLGNSPYTFPPSTIINAGAYLVVYSSNSKFTAIHPTVTNKIGSFSFKLNTFDSLIVKDANNNIVVKAVISDGKFWPDGADGEGRTMELINQNTNTGLNSYTAWRDGCMKGSPGTAPQLDCLDPIIFTEINYNSNDTFNISEFVELYNNTNNDINLSGYFLKDGIDSVNNIYIFQPGTILKAGNYLVVSNDTMALKNYKSYPMQLFGNFNFNLNNGGELIRLYNPGGKLTFSMHYRDTLSWTDSADGLGYTLEIKKYNGRTNDGANYFAGCKLGSPGLIYNPTCITNINSNLLDKIKVYPTIANDNINIENAEGIFTNCRLIDINGRLMHEQIIINAIEKINTQQLQSGLYYIQLLDKKGQLSTYTKKITKL